MLIVIVPILINKGVFEPSFNDLKFTPLRAQSPRAECGLLQDCCPSYLLEDYAPVPLERTAPASGAD